jgi:hypothetical protein
LNEPVLESKEGKEIYLFSKVLRTALANWPPIHWVKAALSPEVSRSVLGAENSPPYYQGEESVELWLHSSSMHSWPVRGQLHLLFICILVIVLAY